MITVQRKLYTKIIRLFDIHRIAMAGHRILRHCRCFIVRIKLDIETNINHILNPVRILPKGRAWTRSVKSVGCATSIAPPMVVSSLIWLSNTELTADLIRYLWIRPYWNSINPKFFPMKCKIVPKRYNFKRYLVTDFVVIATKSNINFFEIACFLHFASLSNNLLFQSTYRRQHPTPCRQPKRLRFSNDFVLRCFVWFLGKPN